MSTAGLVALGLGLFAQPLTSSDFELQTFVQYAEAVQPGAGGPQTILEVYVLRDGAPVEGVEMRINGTVVATTDADGAILARIPSGRADFALVENGQEVFRLDLLTDAGEIAQVIVPFTSDGTPPVPIIENSGRSSILAGERDAADLQPAEEAKDQPPGALVGTVTSEEDGTPVVGARLFFTGVTVEAETDDEGRYEVELPAGVYSISVIQPQYAQQTLDNIRVIPGKEVTADLQLSPAGVRLETYVVTAPYVEGSVASVIEQQREASGVSDVLGAEQISATGDSNAAEALTRVTGLTIEDGKFVIIRGQPQRFSFALFNGSPLPSPEPLLRVIPLDLFPTSVIKDIEVQKSFTPDVPGDFGSGLVRINTRGIPSDPFLDVQVSGGYNSESTFLQGLTYRGGGLDFLGFDDGTRALPAAVDEATNGGEIIITSLPNVNELGMEFPNNLAVQDTTLPPDIGVSLTGGSSWEVWGDGEIGFIATGSWSNQWRRQLRDENTFAITRNGLAPRDELDLNRTDNEIDVNGLITIAGEWEKHEVASTSFVVNSTQQRTQLTTGRVIASGGTFDTRDFFISWIERLLFAQQFSGHHEFEVVSDTVGLEVDWRGLYSSANRDTPDLRQYRFLNPANVNPPEFRIVDPDTLQRSYAFLEDDLWSGGVDLAVPLYQDESFFFRPKPKIGVAGSFLSRVRRNTQYAWRINTPDVAFNTDPEDVYNPANTGDTLALSENQATDDYDGSADVWALYAMLDAEISDLFRVVGGARREDADYEVTSFSLDGNTNTTGFQETNLLPSAAITWFALEQLQVRLAYGRSLSRPVLNELTTVRFIDPESGQPFVGNENLLPSLLDGYDARIEWYPSTTESLSFGVFRKDYTDPIETQFLPLGGGGTVATFSNAAAAQVDGIEVGGRFEFGRFIDWFNAPDWFENISLVSNLSVLQSSVELTEQQEGFLTSSDRQLAGQADYVYNLIVTYDGERHDFTIAFNAIGRRLRGVGVNGQPDIFQDPYPTLDATYTWQIWDDGKLKLSGGRLNNPEERWTQQTEQDDEPQIFRAFRRGADVSLSFTYTFQ
jgi:outer membrane receptor protein involved in Fe transport